MPDAVEFTEIPKAKHIYMIVGWRQWADGGSMSSGLPQYLIQQTDARQIGTMSPDGFYLFQIPGTHDLVRPVINHEEGIPVSLQTPTNTFHYTGNDDIGVVIFLGDEPHLDIERYIKLILDAAATLNVKRIIGLGGVYGELPYNKERMVSCSYSLRTLKPELDQLALNYSDYHGGASIGSYLCQRAKEREMAYIGMYAMVPTYDFSQFAQIGNSIRIENDFTAWLGVMRRVNYLLKTSFDLTELEQKSAQLTRILDDKVEELDGLSPQLNIREYFNQIAEEFTEMPFDPLADVWAEEINRLFDDSEDTE
ncbi:MAG: PAC2 family protein [Anaerolineae bacterium]|nr:PAC2 family protein [Anaerolineae bacterium]